MRVVELSRGVAGGYCGEMLRLIGAEVTRVSLAGASIAAAGDVQDAMLRAYLDRGKMLRTCDLDSTAGREALARLIAEAACVVEDWGPGGLESAGITEDWLRARAPGLVLTRISEFGQEGPWAHWRGSDLVNLAAGGMLFLTGSWDRPPVQLAPLQAPLTAGVLAAVGTAAALYGGEPVTIDLSKQEAVLALITPALSEYAYNGTIPAREGKVAGMARIGRARDTWVYAGPGAMATADYQAYAAFLGIPELAEERFRTPEGRMEHWREHQELLQPKLRERTAREWVDAAADARLTFGLVQTTQDLLDCPVLAERGFFGDLPLAEGTARVPLAPYLEAQAEQPAHRPDALAAQATEVESGPRSG